MLLPPTTLVATMALAIWAPATPEAHASASPTTVSELSRRLERLDADLGKAKADSRRLAAAVREADRHLARAETDLASAQRRFAETRRRSARAGESLGAATEQVWRQEARHHQGARTTGMLNGGPLTHIGYLLSAGSVAEAGRRFSQLSRVVRDGSERLARLREARRLVARSHAAMVASERQATAQRLAVAKRVASLDSARTARAAAKRGLDARIRSLSRRKARVEWQVLQVLSRARSEDAAAHRWMVAKLRRHARLARLAEAAASERRAARVSRGRGRCDLGQLNSAERWIVMRESRGNPAAGNGRSSHFGLGQLSLANRLRYLGKDHATTDCDKQVKAFRAYIASAYGSAAAARSFWRANGWY